MARELPLILAAARVQARRGYDIAAVGLDVYARSEVSTLGMAVRVAKEGVPAPSARDALDGMGQRAVSSFEIGERLVAGLPRVDVEDDQARGCAGCDADVGVRPPGPPLPDDGLVRARIKKAMLGPRMLADVSALGVAT
jgi:hypothetical protein